jgi:hypothetical protein
LSTKLDICALSLILSEHAYFNGGKLSLRILQITDVLYITEEGMRIEIGKTLLCRTDHVFDTARITMKKKAIKYS